MQKENARTRGYDHWGRPILAGRASTTVAQVEDRGDLGELGQISEATLREWHTTGSRADTRHESAILS